jgi:Ca2+-binding RTX toxin-like protein
MSAGTYADFLVALGGIESGDNYSYVSPPGYLGYYQFAEESLQAAGFYAGDNTAARDFAGQFTATAASYGVTDKASFLASPAAQDAAAQAWFQRVIQDINTLDLGKYEGQTLNGVTFTTSGMMAGTHLVGVWALKSYLESGGVDVPTDGNGWPVSDYVQRFGGYDTPFSFDHSGPVSLAGGSGDDALHGFAGNDTLSGGDGVNHLRGADGSDSILGGAGRDDVNGNVGADTIDGGAGGPDWLLGGQGGDLITAHGGSNILNGNRGLDTVTGGAGDDVVRGGQGSDQLAGGAGADHLYGDLGDDTLRGGAGADTFHFATGGGHDVIADFNPAEGDRIRIDDGAHYTLSQSGADTVIALGDGSQLVLTGVPQASAEGWIL